MKKFILGIVLFVSACGQFSPFVDARREAGQVQMMGQSTLDRVAVCYNPLWSDKKKVEDLAKEECAKTKRKAVYDDTKWFSCRLVNPSTAFYDCKKS